jgi:anthranilate phosphoribosyltransferase
VSEWRDGALRTFTIVPGDAGCVPCAAEDLRGGDAARNAAIARAVLSGATGAPREAVVLNAAAALVVAGRAADLAEGARLARESLDRGDAAAVLARVAGITRP